MYTQISSDMQKLFKIAVANNASDLHFVANAYPQMRVDGALRALEFDILSGESIKNLCYGLIDSEQEVILKSEKELDFAFEIVNFGRFRANFYYTDNGNLAATFRVIPKHIPTLDELNSPQILKQILTRQKGLILVTGATGSGKSTTLAAMLNEINLHENKHIITIEDPVEFIHESKNSLFSHRNVGTDTHSFARALKYALREDPDVILVGELRDAETISTAITAAETGHLVLATLHTNSAVQSINRIIDSFGGGEQVQVRNMLSSSLAMIVSQNLVPKIDGGRCVIYEILVNNTAVANLIRENKIHQIYSQMQLNQQQNGMITQAQSLKKAVQSGAISKENALNHSTNVQDFLNLVGM
ncbi:type IV pilus twitching motility protein PilT [Campylobacter sp. faydin G-140]|nr:type IV pilus twitching motility protein PilT [Campylobacter anatolicus]MBR8465554.1 type IV pilus twitching motility protein PilT [Campylobacter anatolicus]